MGKKYWFTWDFDAHGGAPSWNYKFVADREENEEIWDGVVMEGLRIFVETVPDAFCCDCYSHWNWPWPDTQKKECLQCYKSIPQLTPNWRSLQKLDYQSLTKRRSDIGTR